MDARSLKPQNSEVRWCVGGNSPIALRADSSGPTSPTLRRVNTDARETVSPPSLLDQLLDLVPAGLLTEPGEVFYSGATSLERPSSMYLLGFNPGGDPSKVELNRYTVAAEPGGVPISAEARLVSSRRRLARFRTGAVALQRRVRHLIQACGIESPRSVTASSAIFVRSSRIETHDARRTKGSSKTAGSSTRRSFQL